MKWLLIAKHTYLINPTFVLIVTSNAYIYLKNPEFFFTFITLKPFNKRTLLSIYGLRGEEKRWNVEANAR